MNHKYYRLFLYFMSPYFLLLQTHQPCWLVTVNLTQWVILGEGPSTEERPPSEWPVDLSGGYLFSWLLTDVGGAGHYGQSHTWADSPRLSMKATWPSCGEQASQQPSTVVSTLAPGSRFWSWILPQLPLMPSNLKWMFPPSVVLVMVFITATETQTETSATPVDDRCLKRATVYQLGRGRKSSQDQSFLLSFIVQEAVCSFSHRCA